MNLLANDNFPIPSVEMLRAVGHNVLSITEKSPGIEDAAVLALATSERNRPLSGVEGDILTGFWLRLRSASVVPGTVTSEQRVILTFDRDYGELIYRLDSEHQCSYRYCFGSGMSSIRQSQCVGQMARCET